jgi:hypothetical protein
MRGCPVTPRCRLLDMHRTLTGEGTENCGAGLDGSVGFAPEKMLPRSARNEPMQICLIDQLLAASRKTKPNSKYAIEFSHLTIVPGEVL